ncbi:hypothetical protein KIL84_004043 [Mauremys mutica]|uniref:Uncharacterized protein n=1 Tax=Mauremys mutica TaxID=74926 RepID=A0A9D4B6K1_9SAUR|nr:hypothetical protein KIL84_004043 [Mauremys mutica]
MAGEIVYADLNIRGDSSLTIRPQPPHHLRPPGCRLCPPTWLLHGDKCYWLSKDSKKWHESREDCAAKRSRMLVSQDQREMVKSVAGRGNFRWRDVEPDLSKRSAPLTPTPPIAVVSEPPTL